jgi:hypothetical protein
VAGTIDYLTFTRFNARPGWLIYFFYIYEKNKLNHRKDLKSFRSFLKKKATLVVTPLCGILKSNNQPPRLQPTFATL